MHRDMKPENILLSDKLTSKNAESVICKLGDVGLASLRTDPSLATRVHATTKVGKLERTLTSRLRLCCRESARQRAMYSALDC